MLVVSPGVLSHVRTLFVGNGRGLWHVPLRTRRQLSVLSGRRRSGHACSQDAAGSEQEQHSAFLDHWMPLGHLGEGFSWTRPVQEVAPEVTRTAAPAAAFRSPPASGVRVHMGL